MSASHEILSTRLVNKIHINRDYHYNIIIILRMQFRGVISILLDQPSRGARADSYVARDPVRLDAGAACGRATNRGRRPTGSSAARRISLKGPLTIHGRACGVCVAGYAALFAK